jgi:glycosyltransferase involved in cell wall biosynthesis
MKAVQPGNTPTLFIFRSDSRGMAYGIGTYISELVQGLQHYSDYNVFVVNYFNTTFRELTVNQVAERHSEIFIPAPISGRGQNTGYELRYASVAAKLLSRFIPQNGRVIFQMNYIDDLYLVKALKEKYFFPVISIVHFAQFQQLFFGNRQKLKGLNIDNPTGNIEFTLSKEKEFYLVSDHIVSVTDYMKDFLINEFNIDKNKITVVRNGLDRSCFTGKMNSSKSELRKKLGFNDKDIIILFSGRLDSCKGTDLLIESFEKACEINPALKLVLLGQGNISECQKKLHSCFGRVIYTGFIDKETVASFYRIADIGIVPSIYDHCPYTVLEMLANSLPVIASKIDGIKEILDDSDCLFIEPELSVDGDITLDTEKLATNILKLAGDTGLRRKMSESGYNAFLKSHTSQKMAKEMVKIYENELSENNETKR